MKPKIMTNTLSEHKKNPHISVAEHLRSKMISLGEMVGEKKRLYLDMRFWILLREAELGRADKGDELLREIREKVNAGLLICPIEQSVFLELMKQSDPVTRKATAQLIDELGAGVTLVVQEQRVRQEIGAMIYSGQGIDHYSAQELVWTKVTQIFGETIPKDTVFDPADELAIQKSFLDEIWEHSLAEMVEFIPYDTWGEDYAPNTAAQMQDDFKKYDHEAKNFKVTYESEFMGYLELFADNAVDHSLRAYELSGGNADDVDEKSREDSRKIFLDLVYTGLDKKPKKTASLLPSPHIGAICHAAFRMDKQRNITGNDLYDFYHATAAVPYCDAFFTERPLRALLIQDRFNLCEEFSCIIESKIPNAVTWVKNLNSA